MADLVMCEEVESVRGEEVGSVWEIVKVVVWVWGS